MKHVSHQCKSLRAGVSNSGLQANTSNLWPAKVHIAGKLMTVRPIRLKSQIERFKDHESMINEVIQQFLSEKKVVVNIMTDVSAKNYKPT